MKQTILTREAKDNFQWRGAPTAEEKVHNDKAREHFLKYCDFGKCINPPAHKRNWQRWPCTECAFNPYSMTIDKPEAEKELGGAHENEKNLRT